MIALIHSFWMRLRRLGVLSGVSLAVAASFLPRPAEPADTIYFKDGMRTVCHGKAWHDKDEVHCEYDGGILIYPKSDVVRIEKGLATEPEPISKRIDAAEKPSTPFSKMRPSAPEPASTPASGILFYDPRRPKRYWSSASRHHDSYQDALNALAEEYNQTTQWVEAHMGESNDVHMIRETLTANLSRTPPAPESTVSDQPRVAVQFYDPRRPKKYWTGPDARHDTFAQAIQTLATEFKKPAAWIETHMGESNDTEEIRRALRNADNASQGQSNETAPPQATGDPNGVNRFTD